MSSLITGAPLYCPIDAPLYPDSKVDVILEKIIDPWSCQAPVFIPGKNFEEESEFIWSLTGNLFNEVIGPPKDFILTNSIVNSKPYQTLIESRQTLVSISEKLTSNGNKLSDAAILSLAQESELAIENLKNKSGYIRGAFYKAKIDRSDKKHYLDKLAGKHKTENELLMTTWAKNKALSRSKLVNVKHHKTNLELVKKISMVVGSKAIIFGAIVLDLWSGLGDFIFAKNKEERRDSISKISDVLGENLAANVGTAGLVMVLGVTSLGAVTVIAAGISAGIAAGMYFGDEVGGLIDPVLQTVLGQVPLFF